MDEELQKEDEEEQEEQQEEKEPLHEAPSLPKQGKDALFWPSDKDQREEYPELAKVEKFKSLTREELRFVWAYACESSPFIRQKPRNFKISKCFDFAFGRKGRISDKQLYLAEAFPPIVKDAIPEMRAYNPEIRSKAKKMMLDMFAHWERILNKYGDDYVFKDMEEASQYLTLSKRIMNEMPEAIEIIEHSFGISKQMDGSEVNYFDQAMSRRKMKAIK